MGPDVWHMLHVKCRGSGVGAVHAWLPNQVRT